jgi:hypothetical protein
MRPIPPNIVKCSVCSRYYGYAWEAERPGARWAALQTGWQQVHGRWYCYETLGCWQAALDSLNDHSADAGTPEI